MNDQQCDEVKPTCKSIDQAAVETQIISGMGAMPHAGGVAFRVWAPHADSVSVTGTFNDWNDAAHKCEAEGDGNWYINIPEARIGDEYKFALTNGDNRFERIDPRARQVTNSVGNGVIVDPDFDWEEDAFEMPSWNELVIYELHVGTFHRPGEAVGNLDDASERLPYLKELGINAIELMPLAEFAGDYSWGYNPAHPFAVETAYGGMLGLKRFVREAHKHGIAVIIDVVYNHFGPSDLTLWQFDGWSHENKGGIYFYNDDRSSTPWGDTRPDYGRGEVRQYIFDNAMMWLEDYHADGLRYDMTLYMRSVDGDENNVIPEGFNLAQWINAEINKRYPGKITIAEDLRNNALMTQEGSLGGANFSTQWDAEFVHPIRQVITEIDDGNRSMEVVRNAILHKYNLDYFERVVYTESHDEVANGKQRVVSEIDPSDSPGRHAIKRSTLGAAVMFTAPGIPMLMQGQEFLRDKWFDDGRPIDWHRAEQFVGVVNLYRDLINLRLNRQNNSAGLSGQHVEVFHVNDIDKVLAMRRWKEGGAGDDVIVVFNFSEGRKENYKIGLPCGGEWKIRFNSDFKQYNDQLDDTPTSDILATDEPWHDYGFSSLLHIGAYSCLIFSQDP
jgi:1,4-alpha-glucan branching enzyme